MRELPGIDLRIQSQRDMLAKIASFYSDQPFSAEPRDGGPRYHFRNDWFSYGDALALHGMLRLLRPHRLVEVGSGFTSALILDVNERFLDRQTQCTFIDPDPRRMQSLMRPGDERSCTVVPSLLQHVNPAVFAQLKDLDVLFVDSSHVDCEGSDVRMLLRDVLPALAPGVVVHFHDVFWPFEYPLSWRDRGWNEAVALRRLLEAGGWEILLWNDMLGRSDRELLGALMPLALHDPGASMWLRRDGGGAAPW